MTCSDATVLCVAGSSESMSVISLTVTVPPGPDDAGFDSAAGDADPGERLDGSGDAVPEHPLNAIAAHAVPMRARRRLACLVPIILLLDVQLVNCHRLAVDRRRQTGTLRSRSQEPWLGGPVR